MSEEKNLARPWMTRTDRRAQIYRAMVEALTLERGGEYLDRLERMREGQSRDWTDGEIEEGGEYVGLESISDPGAYWNELEPVVQAALNVAGLEFAMLMQDEMDITDLCIGSFHLSIESGHWWLIAARCWLYELTGELDWRKVCDSGAGSLSVR